VTTQPNFLYRVCQAATLLILWSTIASPQTTGAQPQPQGSISGQIIIDGKPAAGIPVAAIEGQTVNRRDARARAVSDVEGRYRLSGLPAGQYQLWTLTPALVAEPFAGPNYFSSSGVSKSILLGADEEVKDVNLRLIRGAVITGRVTTSDNKPVVDERIKLQLLDANGNPRFGALYSSYDQMFQTDDRGIYRIFDLPPGRYRVSAGFDPTSDGVIRSRRYELASYLDPTDQTKAGIVELQEGDEVQNIDIRLKAASPTYTVSGLVTDNETGLPIMKAGVYFERLQKESNQSSPGMILQTDDRGEFTYGGFPPGRYRLSASSEYYSGNFYGDPIEFEVTDKDITGIQIKTVPGLTVTGYLSAEGLSTKDLMTLLPNMIVLANADNANGQARNAGRAIVSADGRFQIGGLRPGAFSLYVSPQRPGTIHPVINRIEREGVAINHKLDLKESLNGLHVVIDYGTGVIRGTVKFEGAVPTESVMFVRYTREGARDGNSVPVDARGHFMITNLAPGPFELTLIISALMPRPAQGIGLPKQILNVTNGAAVDATFVVDLAPKPGGQ